MKLFAPITKIDAKKREVYGVMAEEAVDKSKEIFDYASSKPLIKAWMDQFQKATNGESFGNVRAMHTAVAAGKVIGITFDDAAKNIPIAVRVVDDNEWKKCEEGVYTGFSIGGSYVRKWSDGVNVRYTARPSEVSLVDNPCMYGAQFTVIKSEGGEEMRKFVGAPLSADDIASVRDLLDTHRSTAHKAAPLAKSMWDIGNLATMLENLSWMRSCLQAESDYEGDDSEIPAKLAAWIEAGIPILKQLVDEETRELTDAEKIAKAKENEMDQKEKDRLALLEKENTDLKEKPAKAAPAAAADPAGFVKIGETKEGVEIFKKVDVAAKTESAEVVELKKKVADLEESNKAINEGLQKLLAAPEKPKAAANANGGAAVTKDVDNGAGKTEDLTKLSPLDQITKIHAGGGFAETPLGPVARH